ncbi:hypothetical protein J6590_027641 [Homalodisca vitripennis]|nr:hypothetical protein J6590_027641 [Homalodisca vitripennis]
MSFFAKNAGTTEARTNSQEYFRSVLSRPQITSQIVQLFRQIYLLLAFMEVSQEIWFIDVVPGTANMPCWGAQVVSAFSLWKPLLKSNVHASMPGVRKRPIKADELKCWPTYELVLRSYLYIMKIRPDLGVLHVCDDTLG